MASFHHYNNNNNNNPNCINNNNCTSNNTNNNNILLSSQLHNSNGGSPIYGMIQNNILRDPSAQSSPNHNNYTLPHRHHVHSQSSHQIPVRVTSLPAPLPLSHQLNMNHNNGMDLLQAERAEAALYSNKWSMNGTVGQMLPPGTYQDLMLPPQTPHNLTVNKYSPNKLTVSSSSANSSIMQSMESLLPQGGAAQTAATHPREMLLPPVIPLSNPVASKDGNSSCSSSTKEKIPELPTPTSTPTTSRKNRRRSNLFIPSSKKAEEKALANAGKNSMGELGSGRAIPLKQGYLYKKSSKSLNKEWKKKYVTLCDDGRLTYHPSLHDYMDDVHGKEVQLQLVTVKVPGQKPRGSKSILTNSILTSGMNRVANGLTESIGGLTLAKDKRMTEKVLLTAYDTLREPAKSNSQTSGDEGIVLSNSNSQTYLNVMEPPPVGATAVAAAPVPPKTMDAQTPNVKKRHRRMKSSGVKNNEVDGKLSY